MNLNHELRPRKCQCQIINHFLFNLHHSAYAALYTLFCIFSKLEGQYRQYYNFSTPRLGHCQERFISLKMPLNSRTFKRVRPAITLVDWLWLSKV